MSEKRLEVEQSSSLLADHEIHEKDAFNTDLESAVLSTENSLRKPRRGRHGRGQGHGDGDFGDYDYDSDDGGGGSETGDHHRHAKDGDDDQDHQADDDDDSDGSDMIITTTKTPVPNTVKAAWLAIYFVLNLMLTLYNKYVLVKFHFPWLLTCLHASFASAGTYAMLQAGHFKLSRLGRREHVALVAFSALFTANIAVSNLSLAMVSVPFFQTMRMLTPIFTVAIYRAWFSHSYSTATYASLVPIIVGAGMTTAGELSFTNAGFIITILGVFLATIKTIVTNRFMTGSLSLPLFEFLLRMSPLAALQAFICATATGELAAFGAMVRSPEFSFSPDFFSLFGNGVIAFLLNVASFKANLVSSPLTMNVCANLKQCLTVALGIVLFDVHINLQNGAGMLVTMAGAAYYSKTKLDSKR